MKIQKFFIGSLLVITLNSLLQARSNDVDRIDEYVNKIVLEKDEKIIEQSKFDREYLLYLKSLKNKNSQSSQFTQNNNPINFQKTKINGFKMSR